MMLADLGADIVKVEPPGRGDETRQWGPPFVEGESAYFMSVNRNKRSIVIDLKSKAGLRVLKDLASVSDVLVENFRPGTTSKLRIDYDSIKKVNPGIVYCAVSGFGQTGPYRDRAGYDLVVFAESGQMSITGEQGRPPVKAGVAVSDIGGGMFAAFAIVSALLRRTTTGSGEFIDVSLYEGQISWLTYQAGNYFATGKNPARMGSSHPTIVPYQAFKSKDDYFVIAVGNDELWRKFCVTIKRRDLVNDPRFRTNPERVRNRSSLSRILAKVFLYRTAQEWVTKLAKAGVPTGLINNFDGVFSSPQAKSRNLVIEALHPKAGKIRQLNMPFRMDSYHFKVRMPPPVLGEHTREILMEAGYSRPKIDALFSAKVVAQASQPEKV